MVASYNGQEMNPADDVQRREIARREQNTEEKTHSAKITARDNKKRKFYICFSLKLLVAAQYQVLFRTCDAERKSN